MLKYGRTLPPCTRVHAGRCTRRLLRSLLGEKARPVARGAGARVARCTDAPARGGLALAARAAGAWEAADSGRTPACWRGRRRSLGRGPSWGIGPAGTAVARRRCRQLHIRGSPLPRRGAGSEVEEAEATGGPHQRLVDLVGIVLEEPADVGAGRYLQGGVVALPVRVTAEGDVVLALLLFDAELGRRAWTGGKAAQQRVGGERAHATVAVPAGAEQERGEQQQAKAGAHGGHPGRVSPECKGASCGRACRGPGPARDVQARA